MVNQGVSLVVWDFDQTIHKARMDQMPPSGSKWPYEAWQWCRRFVSPDFVELAHELSRLNVHQAVASYSDPEVILPTVRSGRTFIQQVLALALGENETTKWIVLARYTKDYKRWHREQILHLLGTNDADKKAACASSLLIDDDKHNCDDWVQNGGCRAFAVPKTGEGFQIEPFIEWLTSMECGACFSVARS